MTALHPALVAAATSCAPPIAPVPAAPAASVPERPRIAACMSAPEAARDYQFTLLADPGRPGIFREVAVELDGQRLRTLALLPDEIPQAPGALIGSRFETFDNGAAGHEKSILLWPSAVSSGPTQSYVYKWDAGARPCEFEVTPDAYEVHARAAAPPGSPSAGLVVDLLIELDYSHLYDTPMCPILVQRDGKVAQIFWDHCSAKFNDGPGSSTFMDANFDGHDDLVFKVGSCFEGCHYACYLFDPDRGTYAENEPLYDLPNPEFRPATRTIRSFVKKGGAEYSVAHYQFRDGVPRKVWEAEQRSFLAVDSRELAYRHVVRDFREPTRGEPTVVCDEIIDAAPGARPSRLAGDDTTCAEP